MKTAAEIMNPTPVTVAPTLRVLDVARLLHDERLDGVCVVDNGVLRGVITTMDLLFKEKKIHLPTVFVLFDSVIPLENPFKLRHELDKIAGKTAADLLSADVVSVSPETRLDEIATQMVEHHLSIMPVVRGDKLVGVVSKQAMLEAAFGI